MDDRATELRRTPKDSTGGAQIVHRERGPLAVATVFKVLAALNGVAALGVHALGRHAPVTWATSVTFVLLSLLTIDLARRSSEDQLPKHLWRTLIAVAVLAIVPAHFFGPNSGFAAVVAILLVLLGMLSKNELANAPRFAAVIVYLTVAAGQALAVFLPLGKVIDDRSLVVVIIPGHPDWHHVAAHMSVQGVYLVAFLLGGLIRDRYNALATEVAAGLRTSERRRAMVAEARVEYNSALAAARAGVFSSAVAPSSSDVGPTDDTTLVDSPARSRGGLAVSGLETPPPLGAALPVPELSTDVADSQLIPLDSDGDHPSSYWHTPYRDKMQSTIIGLTAVCVGGAGLFAIIIRDRLALTIGLAALAGITVAAWIYQLLLKARLDTNAPWIVAAALSAGPGYAIGYNSAFASFVAIFMLSSGIFQAGQRRSRHVGGLMVPLAAIGATGTMIILILTGVIADLSNVAARQPGAPLGETITLHILLLATYLVAFFVGLSIDRRSEELARRAHAAAKDAAEQAVLLADAKHEIAQLLHHDEGGLFSSHRLGNYIVGELLGRGGMGEVYAATHVESGGRAALKVLRFDRVSEPGHLKLFLREAEALKKISSPHVARVFDVGDVENGLPFIAMEFIDGEVLADHLAEDGRLSLADVRAMLADIGAGLLAVHRADIIHRDIKPANIILTSSDEETRWKLVDFGIASLRTDSAARGPILGTPRYMSPEQAAGDDIDPRSDLYSLCLVAYRALTGQPAIEGQSPGEVRQALSTREIRDPAAHIVLSEEVSLVLRIGLALDPDHRFANAAELRDAFEDAFAGQLEADLRQRGIEQLEREPWA